MPEFDKYELEGAYHWEQVNPHSQRFNAPLLARYELVAEAIPQSVQSVLDVGCGDGYLLYLLHQKHIPFLVGCDLHFLGIQLAQQKLHEQGKSPLLACNSAYQLPFSDESFDAVTHADVIEHLEHPQQAVAEMARVLKPNAFLILSTPNWHPQRVLSKEHVQEFSPEQLRDLLKPHFHSIQIKGAWHGLAMKYWKRKGRGKKLLAALSRRGRNVFKLQSSSPTPRYEQLIVICQK